MVTNTMTGTIVEKHITTVFALNGTTHARCTLVVETTIENVLGRFSVVVGTAMYEAARLGGTYTPGAGR